jgi:nucleoside-diphosphate-sugar epimerase
VNIALQHFYGPGDDPTKFVTFIIKSLLREEQCIKLTDGKQRRDFIFIDDAVEAILKIIEAYEQTRVGFHRFEVGSGESTTIREFVMLIKKLCNNTNTFLDFGALPYRKGEVMDVYTNIEELLSLGWMPKINLLSGIEQTIKIEREIIIRNNNRDNL